MNEFDERVWVRSIMGLLRERGLERTPQQVRKVITSIKRSRSCSTEQAFESWEAELLASRPKEFGEGL